ncbi:HD domain-containing protein [Geobacter sp. FeAm09]|uniref:HD-GYP domain-containing protein n=1 Tax=Geobacter sp. FeAm09 TaxID=2597769 RepID=UPI0011EE9D44|nr:HD domain-containing phosphohydrolase [Geobacter sp. FeAm09]QEM68258.1 HD domain-containing protein [Geobacter sp. FeAm09]
MDSENLVIQESIRSLLSATANAALYSMGHPQVARLAESAYKGISAALGVSPQISLTVIEDELVINGEPPSFSLFLNRFAEMLASRGIGHVKLVEGLGREEITALIAALASQEGAKTALSSSEHIRFGRVELLEGSNGEYSVEETGAAGRREIPLRDMPAEELARFTEIYEALRRKQKMKVAGIVEIVSAFIAAFRREGESRLVTATMRSDEEYTFTHSANVCILNLAQAMSLGIEGQMLHDIGMAAMLHDIGKLFIPEEILIKKGKLTPREFSLLEGHPVRGARHLLEVPGVPRLAVVTAYEHHMKHDFSGYPKAPDGWRLNLCSQITMISDFFDAMRTRRPYRDPVDLRTIVSQIRERAGSDFHPLLARNFLNVLKRMVEARRSS